MKNFETWFVTYSQSQVLSAGPRRYFLFTVIFWAWCHYLPSADEETDCSPSHSREWKSWDLSQVDFCSLCSLQLYPSLTLQVHNPESHSYCLIVGGPSAVSNVTKASPQPLGELETSNGWVFIPHLFLFQAPQFNSWNRHFIYVCLPLLGSFSP